jgi:MerR family transcriptional regulator, copper efflux regulator
LLHILGAVSDGKLLESLFMRITEAARRLGTSARMLRYREDLGLLPQVRERRAGAGSGASGVTRAAGLVGAAGSGAAGSGAAGSGAAGSGAAGSGAAGSGAAGSGAAHRQFSSEDLEAVAAALELERRYDISPAALAFGVRVLAEPAVRASVADLGRRLGRIPAPASRALDFEKERALRLLQGR